MSEKQTTAKKKPGRKPKANKAAAPVERDKLEERKAATTPAPAPEAGDDEAAEKEHAHAAQEGEEEKGGGDPEQATPAAEGWTVARVLKITKPLMKGEDVKALQAALIASGYHCGASGASGVYERNTAYAVRCFQAANRLIVDGRAGRFTVAALGGTWNG